MFLVQGISAHALTHVKKRLRVWRLLLRAARSALAALAYVCVQSPTKQMEAHLRAGSSVDAVVTTHHQLVRLLCRDCTEHLGYLLVALGGVEGHDARL